MAFDFTHLPGGGGATGPIVTGIDFAVQATLCVGLADLFACFKAVVDIFMLGFDLFFQSIFTGRPTIGFHSATDDLALFYIPSPNPVIGLWGMGIRLLESQGIPISTSNPTLQQKYVNLARAVQKDLERQFTNGAILFTQYAYLGSLKNPDSNTPALEGRSTIDRQYTDAVVRLGIDPKTGFPPPGQPPYNPLSPPKPPPTGCVDPCELALQSILSGGIVPALIQASAAAGLGASATAQLNAPISEVAAALYRMAADLDTVAAAWRAPWFGELVSKLSDLESCVCADLNAWVNVLLPQQNNALSAIANAVDRALGSPKDVAAAEALVKTFIAALVKNGFIQPDLGQIAMS